MKFDKRCLLLFLTAFVVSVYASERDLLVPWLACLPLVKSWHFAYDRIPIGSDDSAVAEAIDKSIKSIDERESAILQSERRKSGCFGMLVGSLVGACSYATNFFAQANARNNVLTAIGAGFVAGAAVYETLCYSFARQWISTQQRRTLMLASSELVTFMSSDGIRARPGIQTVLSPVYEPRNPVARRTYGQVWLPRHDS